MECPTVVEQSSYHTCTCLRMESMHSIFDKVNYSLQGLISAFNLIDLSLTETQPYHYTACMVHGASWTVIQRQAILSYYLQDIRVN